MDYMESEYQKMIMAEHKRDKYHSPTFKRKNLDLGQAQPIWNPSVHDKKRYTNETIRGYVYTPRTSNKLPSVHTYRQGTRPNGGRLPKSLPSRSMSDDILPPLKFHTSFNTHPFSRTPPRTPKWAFQDRDESSPRFQNGTFRVFRPMLYSVLLTNKILPNIRRSGNSTEEVSRQDSNTSSGSSHGNSDGKSVNDLHGDCNHRITVDFHVTDQSDLQNNCDVITNNSVDSEDRGTDMDIQKSVYHDNNDNRD